MTISSTKPAALAAAIGEQGFTLLEGLVAIALLAGTLAAIFALVGSILSSAQRVGHSNNLVQMKLNAIEVMTSVNPMLEQSGKIELGPYMIAWNSAAITPVTDGVGYPLGISLYRVALYENSVQIKGNDGETLDEFKLRQVGYQRVRDISAPLPTTPPLGGATGMAR
jgi:general secretion pathway protein I